jgi:redox-sensitive bicupin YhaK (pirin superfamily)
MHAGSGITHEEMNAESVPTRLFQIWLMPNKRGAEPGWGARVFPKQPATALTLIASGDEGDDALPMHADARVFAGKLAAGTTLQQAILPGRQAYLVASAGWVSVNGVTVGTRDGLVISGEAAITITAAEGAEIVLVETA